MNDLVGLPYGWGCKPESGQTDCWQLVLEVRKRLGLPSPDFEWVYRRWDAASFDGAHVPEWLEEYCSPCAAEAGALAAIPSYRHTTALGVCTGTHLLYVADTVVQKSLRRVARCVRYFHLNAA